MTSSFYSFPAFCRVFHLFGYTRLFFLFSYLFCFLPFLLLLLIYFFFSHVLLATMTPIPSPMGMGPGLTPFDGQVLYSTITFLSLLLLHMCVNTCWICVNMYVYQCEEDLTHAVLLYTMWLGCWWLPFWGCHETHHWRAATKNEQR